MSRGAITLLAIGLSASGCGSSDHSEQRYHDEQRGCSVETPSGWKASVGRDSTTFTSSGERRKHTIVVRSIDKARELKEGVVATNADFVEATAKVLRAMPRAKLQERSEIERGELPGVRFSLTFVPRGQSATYRREHAVLFGKRLFHVIYSAPAGERVDDAAFTKMVTTLSEEG